jgi:imidazolonepropionase-like amidohydrolase
MFNATAFGALFAFAVCASFAARASAQVIAITGGRVFTVSGPVIENGTVVITNGKITAVGVGANVAIPANAQRIDATGKWVTPGLIDANTVLGLSEVGSVGETNDATARGTDNVAAAFTAWEGLNPTSIWFPQARQEGVTDVVVMPRGGLISGQAAIVQIADGAMRDMVMRAPVGMVAEVGNPGSAGTGARAELLLRLRELLTDARFYASHRADFDRGATRDLATSRADLEAMMAVLRGTMPLIVAVNQHADIESALALADEFKLRLIIAGGAEAWMVADKLAAAHVPVLTGAMQNIPSSFATLGQRQENAGLLRRAGVQVALIGNSGNDDETFNVRNIKQEAGNAVAYGMSWNDALRAVTLTPAELFGVADRVGSLQPGRDANVVVWSGDPFEFSTRVLNVFVRGVEYHDVTRSDLLTRKYMNPGR